MDFANNNFWLSVVTETIFKTVYVPIYPNVTISDYSAGKIDIMPSLTMPPIITSSYLNTTDSFPTFTIPENELWAGPIVEDHETISNSFTDRHSFTYFTIESDSIYNSIPLEISSNYLSSSILSHNFDNEILIQTGFNPEFPETINLNDIIESKTSHIPIYLPTETSSYFTEQKDTTDIENEIMSSSSSYTKSESLYSKEFTIWTLQYSSVSATYNNQKSGFAKTNNLMKNSTTRKIPQLSKNYHGVVMNNASILLQANSEKNVLNASFLLFAILIVTILLM